jgi:hypothetical protein
MKQPYRRGKISTTYKGLNGLLGMLTIGSGCIRHWRPLFVAPVRTVQLFCWSILPDWTVRKPHLLTSEMDAARATGKRRRALASNTRACERC